MRLGADDINAARALVQWILRGLGALAIAAGALLFISGLLWDLVTGQVFPNGLLWAVAVRHNYDLSLFAIGAALVFCAPRLSRWIINLPPTGCPRCGHGRVPGRDDARCPECGFDWSRK